MKLGEWFSTTTVNDWNDSTTTLHRRQINEAADWHRAYLQIQELDGRFYWSSNVIVSYDPEFSKLAYGSEPIETHTLDDVKALATKTAYDLLRKAEVKRAERLALR